MDNSGRLLEKERGKGKREGKEGALGGGDVKGEELGRGGKGSI